LVSINYRGCHMVKKAAVLFAILGILTGGAMAKKQVYWIDKDMTVLAFLGDIHGLALEPVRFTMHEKQKIRLFHKRSGPGIYAFHLPGTIITGYDGEKIKVKANGYFLVKVKDIRKSEFRKKSSMKRGTKVPWWPYDQIK